LQIEKKLEDKKSMQETLMKQMKEKRAISEEFKE
jgi:hypothetical protein